MTKIKQISLKAGLAILLIVGDLIRKMSSELFLIK